LGNLATARGRSSVAESLHVQALAERQRSIAEPPVAPRAPTGDASASEDTQSRGALAIALTNVGASHMDRARFDSARIYLDSALAIIRSFPRPDSGRLAEVLNNRATLAMRTGDFVRAAQLAGESYAMNRARLGPGHPRVAGEQANLAFLLDRTGRSAEAEPMAREALSSLRDRMAPDHAMVRSGKLLLGGILSRTGKLEESARLIAEVVAAERARGDHGRRDLSISLDNHAGVLEKLGRMRDAQAAYREAHAVQLAATGEEDPGTGVLLAKVTDMSCRLDGASDALLADFVRALRTLDAVFAPGHGFRLGARAQYGACLARAGRHDDAERELRAAFESTRRGRAQVLSIARIAGRELLALYAAKGDSLQRTAVQAQLDSLGGAPGSR
jgi:tetratricopeptide (TPR) repeat protein